jgi:hypothetical protein
MHGHALDGLIMDDLYCQLTPSFRLVGTSIMLELQKCGVLYYHQGKKSIASCYQMWFLTFETQSVFLGDITQASL